MAALDISTLTLNPDEARAVSEFVITFLEKHPSLVQIFDLKTGVKPKQQIVLVKSMGFSGIADPGCSVVSSGAQAIASQKYWDTERIGDTFELCQADMNELFKPYMDSVKRYSDLFGADSNEVLLFIASLVTEALNKAVFRLAYFGDTTVAASGASAAGLVNAANIKFFNVLDGIFKQVFAGALAGTIPRVHIAENLLSTKSAQTSLAAGRAIEIFKAVRDKASVDLLADPDARLEVSREIFTNYIDSLTAASQNFTLSVTQDGLPTVKWQGYDVVNMSSVWDAANREAFEAKNDHAAYYLPNRVLFIAKSNKPLGTLSETDLAELESWYNRDERKAKIRYGFTLDVKVLDYNQVVVAY